MTVKRFFSYLTMVLMAPAKGLFWFAEEEFYAVPSIISAVFSVMFFVSAFWADWGNGSVILALVLWAICSAIATGAVFGLFLVFTFGCRVLCYGPACLFDNCKRYIEYTNRYIASGEPEREKEWKRQEKEYKKQRKEQEKQKTLQYFINQAKELEINF